MSRDEPLQVILADISEMNVKSEAHCDVLRADQAVRSGQWTKMGRVLKLEYPIQHFRGRIMLCFLRQAA